MNSTKVYIYTLTDPETLDIMYVGKTNNITVRLWHHIKTATRYNAAKNRWLFSLSERGLTPELNVVEIVQLSNWQERERFWIAEFRRMGFPLTNTLAGGNGPGEVSERTRQALSAAKTGVKKSEKTRAAMSAAKLADPKAMAWVKSLGQRPKPEEQKKKMSDAAKGVPKSEAHRKALSAAQTGLKRSRSAVDAVKRALTGVPKGPQSEAHKEALRDAKAVWSHRYHAAIARGATKQEARIAAKKGNN
jgi:hypothetical protein